MSWISDFILLYLDIDKRLWEKKEEKQESLFVTFQLKQ